MSWVIENSRAKSGDFVVLLMIANYAHKDGTGAWPSISTLAKDSRLKDRETQYCVKRLERMGELLVERGAGPNGTNRYTLNMQRNFKGRGAKFAGCSPVRKRVSSTAPEPSLTVNTTLPLPPPAIAGRGRIRRRHLLEVELRAGAGPEITR